MGVLMLFVLGYLWALPVTLVGGAAALVGWTRPLGFRDGALLCVAKPGGLWAWFFAHGFIAATWGGVIVFVDVDAAQNEKVLRHELRHFFQARIFGPLMPLAYGLCWLWGRLQGRTDYYGNFLEEDARRAEG